MNKYTERQTPLPTTSKQTYLEWKSLVPPFFTSLYMRWSVCPCSNIKCFSSALFESFMLDNQPLP